MPAVAALGPVPFDIVRAPLMSWDRDRSTRYVEKPVLGARPPLEWVGEGGSSYSLRIKLHPKKFGGMEALEALNAVRLAGIPVFFIGANGIPYGWVVIEKIGDKHTYLDTGGLGQVVEVDISLRADGPPSAGAFFSVVTAIQSAANLVTGIGARLLA